MCKKRIKRTTQTNNFTYSNFKLFKLPMSDVVLKVENLSKQYRLGLVGSRTIQDDVKRWWYKTRGKEDPFLEIGAVNDRSAEAESDYIWALRDINFEVKQGEVLGIIGKNGAGKSTLLKILSKVTGPTTGTVKAKGRIASLLEVGTGFHPELTGRENIFLNGAILGMTKPEIRAKLDEIIDFAGVAKYVDTPVKRYSSGMKVRLGFAVAAHLEPEILIVDEVLAVGDAEFQKKAIGKMQDVSRGEGRTVLFVSHNMGSVKTLCTRGIVLNNGTTTYEGEIGEVVDYYLNQDNTQAGLGKVDYSKDYIGDENITLLEISVSDKNGRIRSTYSQAENISIRIKFDVLKNVKGVRFNLKVKTPQQEVVFVSSSHNLTKDGIAFGNHILETVIPAFLLNNTRYILAINVGIPGRKLIIEPLDSLFIDIESENANGSTYVQKWQGLVAPKLDWKLY
jgi:homopolymeric O-antigen transport system ATP-binding protein